MSPERSASADDARPWWRRFASLGVLGLIVGLFWNTLGVYQGNRDAKTASESQQISLLTQLNGAATQTEKEINATDLVDRQCEPPEDIRGTAKPAQDAILRSSLSYYEYLAWLFNHDRLKVDDARQFFGHRMISGWRLGKGFLGLADMKETFPELTRFYDASTAAERLPLDCP